MTELTHKIVFRPAFDKRDADPKKNYGIGAMTMTFLVIGPKGAVQWMISTNWYVDSACRHLDGFPRSRLDKPRPMGYDLGYHSKEPHYEDQEAIRGGETCEYTGGPCYYDGSSLNAELPIEGFLAGGEDYLWPKLEALYRSTFEGGEWPFREEAAEARARGAYV